MVLGALTPRVALVVAGLLFASVFALRMAADNAADVAGLFYVIPVALCAICFGTTGGVAAGGLALALNVSWFVISDQPVGSMGYVSRAVAFLLLGALLGRFADERRALERELGRHHEVSSDLVATATRDGYFTRVNPAWSRLLGHQASDLLTRPFIDFVHPDDRESTLAEAAKLAAPGTESTSFRNRYRAADGGYRWLEWNARGVSGGLIYASARDITEKKLSEEALERHKRLLEQLVRERTDALDEARLETLRRLALAAEYRDDDTQQHTERVGLTSALLARELGLPEDDVSLIGQAAPLHDIGKIGISDTILLKPGRLTGAERQAMQEHVQIGVEILASSKSLVLQRASEIVQTHHEWWDGGGYPLGLRGADIPIAGRIVGLVDVFDALTHVRPYKRAFSLEEALAEITALRGRQFDPSVVDAFMRLDHHALVDAATAPLLAATA